MKIISYFFVLTALSICMLSCDKDNNDGEDGKFVVIPSEYKSIEISCGQTLHIPVLGDHWFVEYVEDESSGIKIKIRDTNQKFMTLEGIGTVVAENGWLTLQRDKDDRLSVILKENFKTTERIFNIYINSDDTQDYVKVVQNRGKSYQLVESHFEEMEELREMYIDEYAGSIIVSNPTNQVVWEPWGAAFSGVIYSSEFVSDDFGAFDWMPFEGLKIKMPDLFIPGIIEWSSFWPYQYNVSTQPYVENPENFKVVLLPYSDRHLIEVQVIYCKRVCKYTLTIENAHSGTRFNINGIWTERVPIEYKMTMSLITR